MKRFASAFLLIGLFVLTPWIAAGQTDTTNNRIPNSNSLKLYPNPAKDYTNIYIQFAQLSDFSIIVYDMSYKAQLTEVKVAGRKSYQYNLDVSKLPNGTYKIIVQADKIRQEEILTVKR